MEAVGLFAAVFKPAITNSLSSEIELKLQDKTTTTMIFSHCNSHSDFSMLAQPNRPNECGKKSIDLTIVINRHCTCNRHSIYI